MEVGKHRYESIRGYLKSHYFLIAMMLFALMIALYFMEALQGMNFIIFIGIIFLGFGLLSFENKLKAVILAVGIVAIFGTFMLATGLSLEITGGEIPEFFTDITALRGSYIPVYSEIMFAISGDTTGIWVWVDLIKVIVPFFLIVAGAIFAMNGSWGKVLSCIIACIVLVLMNTILGAGGLETLELGVFRMPQPMFSAITDAFPAYAGNSIAIGFIGLGLYLLMLLPFFGLIVGVWYWKRRE